MKQQYKVFGRAVCAWILLLLMAFLACTPEQAGNVGNIPNATYNNLGRYANYKLPESETTVRRLLVRLKNGTIAGKWVSGDYNDAERADIAQKLKKEFKTATLVRSATAKYNCHSYAWYSQSANNDIWINFPTNYMNAATCKHTQTSGFGSIPTKVKTGDRVVYVFAKPEHSARVHLPDVTNKQLISKWGPAGLYLHSIKDCPYYFGVKGLTLKYY